METSILTSFSETDIQNTQPAMKVGLLATVTPEGMPHVTLISSLMACAPAQLCFGQFTEGKSKQHILINPKVGFLIMGLDKNLWRGKAIFTHAMKSGAEYDYYNNVPMFRYNAYFGVHTVYYLDLISHTGKIPLPMNRISTSVYPQELQAIPAGIPLAVFNMALTMEDVLLRGKYLGIHRLGGVKAGVVKVDWVYNPMPPVPGQVYPPVELKAVKQF
jgi:hypothetical protein